MEIQAAVTRSKVDLTTRMVLMEKRLADLEKRKTIVEKQPADTYQVPRKASAAVVADGLAPSLFFKK
jgi:hypothetical protein